MDENQENALSYKRFLDNAYRERFLEYQRMGFYYGKIFAMRRVVDNVPEFYNPLKVFAWGPLVMTL